MAQNMYKWARMVQSAGWLVGLFPHPLDHSALNTPEWEDFDGSYLDIMDGNGFLKAYPHPQLAVPCHRVAMDGAEFYQAYQFRNSNDKWEKLKWLRFKKNAPTVRDGELMEFEGFYPYFRWAEALSHYDVIYAAGSPFSAYASGKPYCAFSVGGDLQFDCGRADDLGKAMRLAFQKARFLMVSNPHTLGHSRRFGLTNGVYLPYPMDDTRYCPGEGLARQEWERCFGKGVYVLTTSRLDSSVKGHGDAFFQMLVHLVKQRPEFRFIFLAWGHGAVSFQEKIERLGLQDRLIVLPPVGKRRLIDYYRSCDIVLDHFVYGYYGATALEAAAIGKPVIMRLRTEQYAPLYAGDVAPVINAASPDEVQAALVSLLDNPTVRLEQGEAMRKWLVRNHGEARTVPLMLALLKVAADRVPLPPRLDNPLLDSETEEEKVYHTACLVPSHASHHHS
jgi:glycosyltransferase involved in cell wall biosynthesis